MKDHLKGISRIDSKDTHGWLVRHYVNGFTFSKLFSDSKNKSKKNSLIKALMYQLSREDEIRSVPKKRSVQKNNKTGVSGVSMVQKKDSSGKDVVYYVSTWIDDTGRQKTKSFSAKKYGKKQAFELAKSYREQMLHHYI